MKYLYKNCMTAIIQDYYDPNFRGKAKINLKHIPNGHYTVYFLRIGQPIRVSSRLKVLGKLTNVFININRGKLSRDKKPTMELFGSGRLARYDAPTKFQAIKQQQYKVRDNMILNLNSDDDEEEEELISPLDFNKQKNKKEDELEMEFEESKQMEPPKLMNSREYYNNTQTMTQAMIKNPQYQIFSIDEESESIRTSQKSSRYTSDTVDRINQEVEQMDKQNEEIIRQQRALSSLNQSEREANNLSSSLEMQFDNIIPNQQPIHNNYSHLKIPDYNYQTVTPLPPVAKSNSTPLGLMTNTPFETPKQATIT